ncbi:MAG: LytTR family DNA-binding domain-containing protein [Chitinophagales bacterium]
MKYKAIIIDDEAKARRLIQTLIEENCPQIEIVAEAEDVPNAVKAIHLHKPDIVFSDIDMPNYDGFQLLDFVEKADFELIYCTAHNDYALKAFEVSAVGYLVKPVQISLLVKAVEKAIQLRNVQPTITQRLDTLKENIKENALKRIALPVADGLHFVDLTDLLYLEAEGAYTHVVLKNNSKLLISKKLKEFETLLSENKNFFRTHRSFVINTDAIQQYIKSDGGSILMSNNVEIPVARERKEDFQQLFDNIKL